MGGVWGGGGEEWKWEGKREREKVERLKGKEITSTVEKGEGNRTFSYGRVSGSKFLNNGEVPPKTPAPDQTVSPISV